MKALRLLTILAILTLLAVSPPAPAAQIDFTEGDLTTESQAIVHGEVIEKISYWNDNHTLIFTDYTVNVFNALKGASENSTVTVKIMGGEVGNIGMGVTHMPKLELDEEVVLYLKEGTDSKLNVVNGHQGKKTVLDGTIEETGESIQSLKSRLSGANH